MLILQFKGPKALQDIEMMAWSKSHLYMAPKLPTWDPKEPGIINYYGLAPEEGQVDPRATSNSGLHMGTKLIQPWASSIKMHSTPAIGTESKALIYPAAPTTKK